MNYTIEQVAKDGLKVYQLNGYDKKTGELVSTYEAYSEIKCQKELHRIFSKK